MRRNWLIMALALGLGTLLGSGCGQTEFDDALGITLEQLDQIRDSTTLTPQEKREALADLGFSALTINALLYHERLANQWGGDLTSAYDKVANDRLTELTPDEVQYYGDATDVTTYDDAEVLAIVGFFSGEGISSVEQLQAFLDDATVSLPSGIDELNLEGVFITTNLSYVRDKLP